jgi:hypothetical protein
MRRIGGRDLTRRSRIWRWTVVGDGRRMGKGNFEEEGERGREGCDCARRIEVTEDGRGGGRDFVGGGITYYYLLGSIIMVMIMIMTILIMIIPAL